MWAQLRFNYAFRFSHGVPLSRNSPGLLGKFVRPMDIEEAHLVSTWSIAYRIPNNRVGAACVMLNHRIGIFFVPQWTVRKIRSRTLSLLGSSLRCQDQQTLLTFGTWRNSAESLWYLTRFLDFIYISLIFFFQLRFFLQLQLSPPKICGSEC